MRSEWNHLTLSGFLMHPIFVIPLLQGILKAQLSFTENREMIRHWMAGIAQASDGWNQFLSHQGGFGHATFRPSKHHMKHDVRKNATFIEIKKSSSFQSWRGSTTCNQLPKHSNTESDQLTPTDTVVSFCPFHFLPSLPVWCSPSKFQDTANSFHLPKPSSLTYKMWTSSRRCFYLLLRIIHQIVFIVVSSDSYDYCPKSLIIHPVFVSLFWTTTIFPSNKKTKTHLQHRPCRPFVLRSPCQGAPCCRISAVNLLMAWSTSPRWTGPWSLITWTNGWWWIRMVQCDIQIDRRLRDGPAMHHKLCAPESPTVGLQVSLGCKGKVECLHDLNTN